MSLITKYRPTNFSQVIGHKDEIEAILSKLKKEDTQAIILTGLRGTGKTTTARLIGAWLNCENENKSFDVTCNCDNCLAAREGTLSDILEYDAANLTGVDNIRELKEKLRHFPQNKYRIVIIDECHKLSNSAQNALLKPIEEPPKNTLFILCTTELNKVIPTIISRCTHYHFNEVSTTDTLNVLQGIITKEEITIDKKYITLIAKNSNGSVRDAISLLNKVSQIENLTEDNIYSLIGGVSITTLSELFLYIFSYDIVSALGLLKTMFKTNIQPDTLYTAIEDFLQVIVYGLNGLTDDTIPTEYLNIIRLVNNKDITRFLKIFFKLRSDIYVLNKLFFDVLVLDYCNLDTTRKVEKVQPIVYEEKKVTLPKPKPIKKQLIQLEEEPTEEMEF